MSDTTRLKLPLIAAQQAQKHVTHNESLLKLDVLVQASVLDRDLNTQPASPAEGDAYIVAASASSDWAGQEGNIAAWQNGGWVFHAPSEGWKVWVADEDTLYVHDGTAWVKFETGITSVNPVPDGKLGINTIADATNRLAVKSDAVLFSHDDVTPGSGDVQFKVNKAAAANTASLLFQTDWSGRAEMGLAGDDDFHLKISPDGIAWNDAFIVAAGSGDVSFSGIISGDGSGLTNVDAAKLGGLFASDYVKISDLPSSSVGNADTVDGRHASEFALLSGATFSGRVRMRNAYIGSSFYDRGSGGGSASIEIGGPTSSWVCNVQDGSGRVNFRWNATAGPAPAYVVSNEAAVEWDIDDLGAFGFTVRYAPPGTAGNPISWTTLMSVKPAGTTFNGNITSPAMGVNTTTDATNRLAVKSDAVLFSHDDVTPGSGDMRLTVNKAASTNIASLLFQTNWSGRAEIGIGNDDLLRLRASSDGNAWLDGLSIDPVAGVVRMESPASLPSYSKNNLPSASTMGAGTMIYVHDDSAGPTVAFSDGTNWRRVHDRNVVA